MKKSSFCGTFYDLHDVERVVQKHEIIDNTDHYEYKNKNQLKNHHLVAHFTTRLMSAGRET